MEFSFNQKSSDVVVSLGGAGDILNIIPAMASLGLRDIIVHNKHMHLASGFSYLKFWGYDGDIENLAGAVDEAKKQWSHVMVPQLFGLKQPQGMPPRKRDSFVKDQWDRLLPGLGDMWGSFPLVVDTRGHHAVRCREEAALRYCNYDFGKRMLIVCLESFSSPYQYAEDIRRFLRHQWADKFEIVDLYRPLPRFLDLLGLMGDYNGHIAAGMICIDTAPLHLSRAVPSLPVFQLQREGCDGTPKMGDVATVQSYSYDKMDKLGEWLRSLDQGVKYL